MSTLKQLTLEKHKEAESLSFIKSIFEGQVDPVKYSDYLYQLYMVYYFLEQHGDKLFDGIEDMKRTKLVLNDFLESVNYGNFKNTALPDTKNYLDYLNTIRDDSKKLLAHIYVRHMGDLFGGQQLKKLVPGSGKMFDFNNIPALIVEMRKRCGPELAEEANVAFDWNIKILRNYS